MPPQHSDAAWMLATQDNYTTSRKPLSRYGMGYPRYGITTPTKRGRYSVEEAFNVIFRRVNGRRFGFELSSSHRDGAVLLVTRRGVGVCLGIADIDSACCIHRRARHSETRQNYKTSQCETK